MATDTVPLTIQCDGCKKELAARPTKKGEAKLPRQWKRIHDMIYCPACKKSLYRLRAITLSIDTVLDGEWADFRDALTAAWGRSTRLANWAVRMLLRADGERASTHERLADVPFTMPNLYELWNETPHLERPEWNGSAIEAGSLLNAVASKYRKARLGMIWRSEERPPRMTYPVPYPIASKSWQAEYVDITDRTGKARRVPVVNIPLGGRRWQVALSGDAKRFRQLQAFAEIVSGAAVKGEAALYRVRSSQGAHRRTGKEKAAGGGPTFQVRYMMKLVAYLPATEKRKTRKGVLEVSTGSRALLLALSPGRDRPWVYHADHLRRLIFQHERQRQHLADDLKAEHRPMTPSLHGRLDVICHRHRCRMDSELRRIVACVVGVARRAMLGKIAYDDREHGFIRSLRIFPWAVLRRFMQEGAANAGLEYDYRGDATDAESG